MDESPNVIFMQVGLFQRGGPPKRSKKPLCERASEESGGKNGFYSRNILFASFPAKANTFSSSQAKDKPLLHSLPGLICKDISGG